MFTTRLAALLLVFCFANLGHAQEKPIKTFNSGSYQQILRENAGKPFILAIWSVDCPSCLKDMKVLYDIHQKHPDIKIVMLSTDPPNMMTEVQSILTKYQLDGLDNWIFGSDDTQKLRYEIDASWYGELPRTYFFSASHTRTGKSGALKNDEIEAQIANIKP